MTRLVLMAVGWSLLMGTAWAETATLTWNPNREKDLAGYTVYRSTASGNYGAPLATLGKVTTYTVTLPPSPVATRYFFRLTAHNAVGMHSAPSAEVSKMFVGTPVAAACLKVMKQTNQDVRITAVPCVPQ